MGMRPYVGQATGIRALWPNGIIIHKSKLHLIREGSGQLMAGDGLMPFVPGHVAMIGSNLPHNWLSDISVYLGERLSHRDVLCHIRPQTMRLLTAAFPETSGFETVLRRSQHALVLFGDSAREAGELLVAMGEHSPVRRVADLIAILTDIRAGISAGKPDRGNAGIQSRDCGWRGGWDQRRHHLYFHTSG